MSKSKIGNVEFSLGKRTLLVTVKDDNGRFVDSKFFEIAHEGLGVVIKEAKAEIYRGDNCKDHNQQNPS